MKTKIKELLYKTGSPVKGYEPYAMTILDEEGMQWFCLHIRDKKLPVNEILFGVEGDFPAQEFICCEATDYQVDMLCNHELPVGEFISQAPRRKKLMMFETVFELLPLEDYAYPLDKWTKEALMSHPWLDKVALRMRDDEVL